MDETVIPETRRVLQRLAIDDDSPCRLTLDERTLVVFYMSCETLDDIATCPAFMFVATLRRRVGERPPPKDVTLAKLDNFRYGPIAQTVIAHVKNELVELEKPDPSSE
ncbi:MAG TPA: hypothetical protein VJ843_01925 [Candidatus Saccharimonadales bacterium]|nr:hypothetical protein [Candidatus Saccharimonadales bacterium]